MALELIAALALVGTNGLFVATEFSITRVRPTQLDELEREGRPGARSVRHAVEHLDAYLAACQLGITVSSLGLGALGKPAFAQLLEPLLGPYADVGGIGVAGVLAFGFITLMHVVAGEISPKSLAIARTGRTVLLVAPPMRLFYLIAKPLVDGFNWLGNLLLRPFGIPPAREAGFAPHSERELLELLRESGEVGLIDPAESDFAQRMFAFGDRRAREVLVPRSEVVYATTDDDVRSALERAWHSGYTRLPLCKPEGGLDAAVGVLHVKDLVATALGEPARELRDLARPLPRVADSTHLDELLRALRRERHHIALVCEEHGTTIGLLTLEDVIEELVGEIEDEFDPVAAEPLVRNGNSVTVPGSTSLHQLADVLEVELAEDGSATVGGHVMERLGRRPDVGECLMVDGHLVEVTEVNEFQIVELRFTPATGTPASEPVGPGRPTPSAEAGEGQDRATGAAGEPSARDQHPSDLLQGDRSEREDFT
jgi:CBS domain containing-hemolysin-like protein